MADDNVEIPLKVTNAGAASAVGEVEEALRKVGATAEQAKNYLDELMKVPEEGRDAFVAPLLDMAKGAEGAKDAIEDLMEEMFNWLGLGALLEGGAKGAIAAFDLLKEATVSAVENFVDFGHKLDIVHEKLNIPVELAAAWQQSSEVTGVSADKVANSIAQIESRLATGNAGALQAMQALHISVEEFNNANPAEQVKMLSEGFEQLRESGGNVAVTMRELAGRQGFGLLPFLAKDIQEELIPALEKINGPLKQQVKDAHDFEVEWDLVKAKIDATKRSLVEPLFGGMADFMKGSGGNLNPSGIIGATLQRIFEGPKGKPVPSGVGPPVDTSPLTVDTSDVDDATKKQRTEYAAALAAAYAKQREALADLESPEAAHIQRIKDETDKEIASVTAKYGHTQATADLTAALIAARDAQIAAAKATDDSRIAEEVSTALQKESAAAFKASADFYKLAGKSAEELTIAEDGGTQSIRGKIEVLQQKAAVEKEAIDQSAQLAESYGLESETIAAAAKAAKDDVDAKTQLDEAQVRLTASNKEFNAQVKEDERAQRQLEKATRDFQRAQREAWDAAVEGAHSILGVLSQVGGAFGQMLGGIDQGIGQFKSGIDQNLKGGDVGGLGGMMMQIGGLGQMASAAVGVIKSIVGLFSHPEYQKVMDDVGKSWGVSISEGLAKQIESTETKDHVSRSMAELLNLSSIMGESGKSAGSFAPQVDQLMSAIASGSVDATQGLAQVDQAFQKIQQEAAATDDVGNRAMVGIIQHARELNLQDQAISKYVQGRIDDAANNMKAMLDGMENVTPQLAADEGAIFSDVFWGKVKEEGIVAASKSLGDAYDKAMADMQAKGIAVPASMQAIGSTIALGRDPRFQATATGVDASDKILRGLSDSAYLTKASFDAFGDTAKAQYDQAIADGATRQQAAQLLQQTMSDEVKASQNYGYQLTQTDKDLIAEMEKSGVHLLKEPAQKQVDLLGQIRDGIYALAKMKVPTEPGSGSGSNTGGGNGGGGGGGQSNDDLFEASKRGQLRIARSAIVDQY